MLISLLCVRHFWTRMVKRPVVVNVAFVEIKIGIRPHIFLDGLDHVIVVDIDFELNKSFRFIVNGFAFVHSFTPSIQETRDLDASPQALDDKYTADMNVL